MIAGCSKTAAVVPATPVAGCSTMADQCVFSSAISLHAAKTLPVRDSPGDKKLWHEIGRKR